MKKQQIFVQVSLAFGRNSVKSLLKSSRHLCLKSFSLNFRPTLKKDSKFFRLWSKSILFVKLFVWHCISFPSILHFFIRLPHPLKRFVLNFSYFFCFKLGITIIALSCLLSFLCCARKLELHKKLWIVAVFIQQSRQQQKRSFALRLLS